MNRRILFLVDHKQRDLPSLTLISCYLEQQGFEPQLIALGTELDVIERFDPQYIVLPKPIYDFERLVRWKRDGRRLIVIETEGNPQDLDFELRIRVAPDLYLFWNQIMADRYRAQLEREGTAMRVLGFPRTDFLHERLHGVFPSRAQLLSKYGLDAGHRTLTIATCSPDSHFSEERVEAKRRRRSRSFAKSADYMDHVNNQRELRDKTVVFVRQLVESYPRLNIALKPHPNENTVFWHDFLESLDCPRVALVVGEPVNHLLRVSDLHLSHNVCTTTVEALLAGVPVAEIHTGRSASMYGARHLSIPTYQIMDFADLARAIDAEVIGEPAHLHLEPSSRAKLDSYVSDFFSTFDGRRCEAYADTIAEWARTVETLPRESGYLLARPKQSLLFAAVRLRAITRALFAAARHRRQREIIAKVNAPDLEGVRSVRQIKGVLVDEEFGLYDNRMRPRDEKVWVERFRLAGLVGASADEVGRAAEP